MSVYAQARCPWCGAGQMVDVTNPRYRELGILCAKCDRISEWHQLKLVTCVPTHHGTSEPPTIDHKADHEDAARAYIESVPDATEAEYPG